MLASHIVHLVVSPRIWLAYSMPLIYMIIHVHVLFVCEVPKGTCWGSANSVPVVIMLVDGSQLVWSHSLAKPTSEIDPQMS